MHTGVRGIPAGRGKGPDDGRVPLTESTGRKVWNPSAHGEDARGNTGKVDGGGWQWTWERLDVESGKSEKNWEARLWFPKRFGIKN